MQSEKKRHCNLWADINLRKKNKNKNDIKVGIAP